MTKFKYLFVSVSNEFKDFNKVSAKITKIIREIQSKGYYPVVVFTDIIPDYLMLPKINPPILAITEDLEFLKRHGITGKNTVYLDFHGNSKQSGRELFRTSLRNPEYLQGVYKITLKKPGLGKDSYIGKVISERQSIQSRMESHIEACPDDILSLDYYMGYNNYDLKILLAVDTRYPGIPREIKRDFLSKEAYPGNISDLEGRLIFQTRYNKKSELYQKTFNKKDEYFHSNFTV